MIASKLIAFLLISCEWMTADALPCSSNIGPSASSFTASSTCISTSTSIPYTKPAAVATVTLPALYPSSPPAIPVDIMSNYNEKMPRTADISPQETPAYHRNPVHDPLINVSLPPPLPLPPSSNDAEIVITVNTTTVTATTGTNGCARNETTDTRTNDHNQPIPLIYPVVNDMPVEKPVAESSESPALEPVSQPQAPPVVEQIPTSDNHRSGDDGKVTRTDKPPQRKCRKRSRSAISTTTTITPTINTVPVVDAPLGDPAVVQVQPIIEPVQRPMEPQQESSAPPLPSSTQPRSSPAILTLISADVNENTVEPNLGSPSL